VAEPLGGYQVGDRLAVHRYREGLPSGYSPHDLRIVIAQLGLSDSDSAMR